MTEGYPLLNEPQLPRELPQEPKAPVVSEQNAAPPWKEFEDILKEIDSLAQTLKDIKIRGRPNGSEQPLDVTLDAIRNDAAKLLAHRILPLATRLVNIPRVTLFGKMVAKILQSNEVTFRESTNRFGLSFNGTRGSHTDTPPHDHRLAQRLLGTFAKATFPTSITRTQGMSVDVQIDPTPDPRTP